MNVSITSSHEMVRCFVAIPLEPDLIDKLRQVQQMLRRRASEEAVRWVGPEQMHLTLKFFGDTPSSQIPALAQAAQQACHGVQNFQLEARGLGCFPNLRQPRVIWVGIHGERERLLDLHARLDQQTRSWGSHEETREFNPHLTLGRIKTGGSAGFRGLGDAIKDFPSEPLGTWTVRQVLLIQSRLTSQGSQYSTLAEARLL